jgi:hypothetical protein
VLLDLHCHSTRSDGSLPPAQVGALVRERGIELFCLTDHDTMAGTGELVQACAGQSRVLRGLELSCRDGEKTVHVIVLGVEPGAAADELEARLRRIQAARRERIRHIAARLEALGFPIDPEEILARAGVHGRTVGRPDVARALVTAGHVRSPREAFDRFLKDGGSAEVPVERVHLAEGLELAAACGARCALAHPHTLDPSRVRDLFRRHRAQGLTGLEAWYGRYGPAEREPWLRLAADLQLVVTAGSDFHGDLVPEVTRPGVELPSPYADRLREWLGVG